MCKITKMLLDKTAKGRPGKKIKPKGLVIHWTANTGKGSDADNNRNYFNNSGKFVSAHYIVDDHQIVQCLPENEMAYHVGAKKYKTGAVNGLSRYPNDCTIGIEICVNKDGNFDRALKNAVELAVDICKRHGWTRDNLWRHYDITGKDCPRFFVDNGTAMAYGYGSASLGWERFRADVEIELTKGEKKEVAPWKKQIIKDAKFEGLINEDHDPDAPATKWFVLAIGLNLLKKVRG